MTSYEAAPIARVLRTALPSRIAWRLFLFELQRLCAEQDVSHQEVADRIGVSRASVSQAIIGRNLFSRPAAEVVVGFLHAGPSAPYLLGLHAVARSGKRGDSPTSGDFDPDLPIALEAIAKSVTAVDFTAIPDLLRTTAYAEHLHHSAWGRERHRTFDAGELKRRQQVFSSDSPARLIWYTDEHALRRLVDTVPHDTVSQQLRHLVLLAESKVAELRIIPAARTPAAPPPSFSAMVLDDGHTSVHQRTLTTTGCADIGGVHLSILDEVNRAALSPTESVGLVHSTLRAIVEPAVKAG